MNPTDEGGTMASALSLLSGASLNSLDGPFPRQVTDPTKRKLGFGFGADGTVEDAVQLRPAATAAQCAVCHAHHPSVHMRSPGSRAAGRHLRSRGEQFHSHFPRTRATRPPPATPDAPFAPAGLVSWRQHHRVLAARLCVLLPASAPLRLPRASPNPDPLLSNGSASSRRSPVTPAAPAQVVDAVLDKQAIQRMVAPGAEGAALAFYVIKDRKGDSEPTPPEKHAIKLACQMLIKDDAELADVLVKHLALFASQWQALVEGGPAAEAMARLTQTHPLEKQGDAVSEAAGSGAPLCEDKHPLCAKWAAKGECTANPSYMVGGGHHAGQCRKSCRACSSQQTLAEAVQEDKTLGPKLEQLVAGLQLAVRNLGCGASKACLAGVSGAAWPLASDEPASGEDSFPEDAEEGLAFLSSMNVGGGFVLGKPFFGIPSLKQLPLSSLPPHLHPPAPVSATTAPATAPAAKTHSRGKLPATGRPSAAAAADAAAPAATAAAATAAEVDAVLAGALAGRLVRLPTEYFTFEYLYKNHTRHYHQDAKTHQITEEWSLGGFSRESISIISSVTGEAAVLEDLDLLPDRRAEMRKSTWPYVKQVYAGGQECVLAGGRKAVRRSEVRLACSPDSKLRILIREPDFCHYVFIIYVPQLCDMPFYAARALQT
ncbi:MAG: hypothetical protein WDW38_008745 [Sanguina aurantia]